MDLIIIIGLLVANGFFSKATHNAFKRMLKGYVYSKGYVERSGREEGFDDEVNSFMLDNLSVFNYIVPFNLFLLITLGIKFSHRKEFFNEMLNINLIQPFKERVEQDFLELKEEFDARRNEMIEKRDNFYRYPSMTFTFTDGSFTVVKTDNDCKVVDATNNLINHKDDLVWLYQNIYFVNKSLSGMAGYDLALTVQEGEFTTILLPYSSQDVFDLCSGKIDDSEVVLRAKEVDVKSLLLK